MNKYHLKLCKKNETWSKFNFQSINLNSKEIYGIIMIIFNSFFSALYIFLYGTWKFHNQVTLLQDICEPENLLGSRNCGLFSSLLRKSRAGISFLHINASSFTWSSETSSRKLVLKVSKFQNEFMKSLFLPKYEPKIVRISAL